MLTEDQVHDGPLDIDTPTDEPPAPPMGSTLDVDMLWSRYHGCDRPSISFKPGSAARARRPPRSPTDHGAKKPLSLPVVQRVDKASRSLYVRRVPSWQLRLLLWRVRRSHTNLVPALILTHVLEIESVETRARCEMLVLPR